MIRLNVNDAQHVFVKGKVGIGDIQARIVKVVVGVVGGNRVVWEYVTPEVPTDRHIYCGTVKSGQDFAL